MQYAADAIEQAPYEIPRQKSVPSFAGSEVRRLRQEIGLDVTGDRTTAVEGRSGAARTTRTERIQVTEAEMRGTDGIE